MSEPLWGRSSVGPTTVSKSAELEVRRVDLAGLQPVAPGVAGPDRAVHAHRVQVPAVAAALAPDALRELALDPLVEVVLDLGPDVQGPGPAFLDHGDRVGHVPDL